jgi:hypothetical protein
VCRMTSSTLRKLDNMSPPPVALLLLLGGGNTDGAKPPPNLPLLPNAWLLLAPEMPPLRVKCKWYDQIGGEE